MSDQSRAFPDRPSLRYLKLEAKRRLAAGEFATLDLAQLAIAREHGLPSWTALKQHIEGHALPHLRWVVSRFAEADAPEWTPPGDEELRRHFTDDYLSLVPPDWLNRLFRTVAVQLRAGLADVRAEPPGLRARVADLRVEAASEAGPPYRLRQLRFYPLERTVRDPRVAHPPAHAAGPVPHRAAEVAAGSLTELGLVGLLTAGATGDGAGWVTAHGWADLAADRPLLPEHPFPAYAITELVTATAVLRLVADGRVGLDEPANAYLRTVRLADDAITVRQLLSHTDGVDNPDPLFADHVPELVDVIGSVAACGGRRGTFDYRYGGYATLGAVIADVTGSPYADAATTMVLEPLGMTGSWFPPRPPAGPVTGHRLTDAGVFEPEPTRVSTVPSVGGLWTTAADLVRFGRSWSTLMPGDLAGEALRPQADRGDSPGGAAGLGWGLVPPKDVAGHPGAGSGFSASLVVRPSTGDPLVVVTNRQVLVEAVTERLLT